MDGSEFAGAGAALAEDELLSAARRLRRAASPEKATLQRIQSYVATLFDCSCSTSDSDHRSLLESITLRVNSSRQRCDRTDTLMDELIAPLRDAISDGRQSGCVSCENPDADAQAIFHLVLGMLATHAAGRLPSSREQLEHMAIKTIRRALSIAGDAR